jgi:molecular chaperone GrpE
VSESNDSGFSFQDNRKIDPDTFAVREPQTPAPADDFEGIVEGIVIEEDLESADAKVAELTADLQRVHAEYANYRKRVDRERESNRDLVAGSTLAELLPILDDIGRAREHGDLDGAFKSVAEALESTVTRLGIERFGIAGDEFDPTIHEAISHQHSAEVTGPTCVSVFQQGYRFKGRILRPAIVAVADPE